MNIYPEHLEQIILKTKYIPRKIKNKERLKIYHKYWIPELKGLIKVIDIFYIGDIEYYVILYNKSLTCCLSYPIEYKDSYELLHNHDNIEKQNIINSNKPYTGAEIKYWLVYNKNTFNYIKYSKYLIDEKYLLDNHKYLITDNKIIEVYGG